MRPDPTRCEVAAALDAIVGKWKTQILLHLFFEGTMRFGELRTAVPGITHKALTENLRELEAHGIVERRVYPEVPPKVEYSLTEYGRTLGPVLRELHKWGARHRRRLREMAEQRRGEVAAGT